jgi:O-antigen ligase
MPLFEEWWRPETAPALAGAAPRLLAPGSRWSGASFAALMAFTFVLLLAPQSFVPALAPLRIGLLTALLALTAYLLDRFAGGDSITIVTPELLAAAALVTWALLTLPLSYWPGGSLSFLLDVYFKTLVIFWLLANVTGTRPRLRRAAGCLVLMTVPLAAFAVHAFATGQFIDADGPVRRIAGVDAPLTQNPNDLALMLNLVLPLALALAQAAERGPVRLAFLACAVLDAVGVILTFSRAGFICLAITAVLSLWKAARRPWKGWAFAVLVLTVSLAPFLPHGYLDRLGTITDIQSDPTGSAQERWSDTQAAVRYVAAHPILGAGVGMNVLALNEARGASWKNVHNVFLQYAVDLGLPGVALFLALFAGCVRATVEAMRRAAAIPAPDLFLLAEGLQISLLAFAVAALFHPVAYHFYFYYVAGLAIAARAAAGAPAEGTVR